MMELAKATKSIELEELLTEVLVESLVELVVDWRAVGVAKRGDEVLGVIKRGDEVLEDEVMEDGDVEAKSVVLSMELEVICDGKMVVEVRFATFEVLDREASTDEFEGLVGFLIEAVDVEFPHELARLGRLVMSW